MTEAETQRILGELLQYFSSGLESHLVQTLVIQGLRAVYGVVAYVLMALGLQQMARRRGLPGAWLSWLPIGNLWVLGSISDHYQRTERRQVRRRRKHFMTLTVMTVLSCILFAILLSTAAILLTQGARGRYIDIASRNVVLVGCGIAGGLILLFRLIVWILRHMALYDLYRSSRPGQAVLFLVLGIFFRFLTPIFVFACRKLDPGMVKPGTKRESEHAPEEAAAVPEDVEAPPAEPVPEVQTEA